MDLTNMLGNTHRALEVTEAQQFARCHLAKYEVRRLYQTWSGIPAV